MRLQGNAVTPSFPRPHPRVLFAGGLGRLGS